MTRSVDIQSVVYMNGPSDLIRAAEAVANAARVASEEQQLGTWSFLLGDGSPEPMLTASDLLEIEKLVAGSGGVFQYEVFGENLGSAAGHNRLAALGNAEQLVILNPDALMDPLLLATLLGTVAEDIGFIEARQLPVEHPKEYESATGDTAWGSTACAMIPRGLFNALNGFDSETFFLYCDDVDFSWRVRLAGQRVVYQPAARLFHDKRLTSTGDWPSSNAERYFSAEAALLLAYKYSRPDVLNQNLAAFRMSADPDLKRALATFEERKASGRLPQCIDPENKVATFVSGNYTEHRY